MGPDQGVPTAQRLVTLADVDDQAGDRVSVSAFHAVELVDGSRVLLLDDRGWGSSATWAASSVADIRETTRTVVGPYEPPEGRSYEAEEALHWASLQQIAQRQGFAVDAHELSRLPHDVVLTERLRARVGRGPGLHASD
ncbi:hypothetical protein [Haloactinomyces albus]|uniref:Uncharacterized protein n=1 Tax=Haloactinomyces albus TaxID=1352928 RepID=A0AAE4CMU1_9ACTN|nr:hypothetical protein [Haloactinomyces albus]MDR7303219.1 hypothetical protein [Haloactinomyces albus]